MTPSPSPSVAELEFVNVAANGDDLAAVLALAKAAKHTVGFLPDSAFSDRARQGTLIGVRRTSVSGLLGYVLYDLPRDQIKLVQLVVDPAHDGHGLARAMVSEVERRHASRRGIALSCRNDYPAHGAWPRLGFAPIGERPGRSIDGKPLTRWWKHFGNPDLISLIDETDLRPTAVLDSCTFFDLIADEPDDVAQQIKADWIGDHARLAATDELWIEIAKGSDPALRARQNAAANRLPRLSPPEPSWRSFLDELKTRHPGAPSADEYDLRQLARAMAAEASWLVTTDTNLRTRYGASAAAVGGLKVMSPAEFVRDVDAGSRTDWYRPVELERTDVELREVDGGALASLGPRFVNHQGGETIGNLRSTLDRLAADPHRVQLRVLAVDGELRALWAIEDADSELHCHLLRVTPGVGESVIARHVLALLRERSAGPVTTIRVRDEQLGMPVRRNLVEEGYIAGSGTMHVAISVKGHGQVLLLRRLLDDQRVREDDRATAIGALESADGVEIDRLFAPYVATDAHLPTFVVPIKHHWAIQLFDSELANTQLFHRNWNLGLRRELVYYRSSRNPGTLRAPARILWYVSGSQPGGQTIRATSLLTEIHVAPPEQLHHRFERLGVYKREQVIGAAGETGRAMALRFRNTQLLPKPVPLGDYRKLADAHAAPVMLRSPQEMPTELLARVLEVGGL